MSRTLDQKGDETVVYPGSRSVTTVKFPQGSPAYGQIHQMIENIKQPNRKERQGRLTVKKENRNSINRLIDRAL